MWECAPLIFLGPLSDTILYLNKYKFIGNHGELSDPEYICTKTEKVTYLQNTNTHIHYLASPFKQLHIRFKQAQDHKKQWRIG